MSGGPLAETSERPLTGHEQTTQAARTTRAQDTRTRLATRRRHRQGHHRDRRGHRGHPQAALGTWLHIALGSAACVGSRDSDLTRATMATRRTVRSCRLRVRGLRHTKAAGASSHLRRRPTSATTTRSTSTRRRDRRRPRADGAGARAVDRAVLARRRARPGTRGHPGRHEFEFGGDAEGVLRVGDEVLTPDSSRFWPADTYEVGRPQPSFDKQYVRD